MDQIVEKQKFLNIQKPEDFYINKEINVILALEGGGARGIAHVSALKEIEKSNNDSLRSVGPQYWWPRYNIAGVCGTSIGALVASLIASGYSSDELFDEKEGKLTSVAMENAEFRSIWSAFGKFGKYRVKILRAIRSRPKLFVAFLSIFWLSISILTNHIYLHVENKEQLHTSLIAPSIKSDIAMVLFFIASIFASYHLLKFFLTGLCSSRRLSEGIDKALAQKLSKYNTEIAERFEKSLHEEKEHGKQYKKVVKFKHLPIPLSVIATDIRHKTMKQFSGGRDYRGETPDTYVGDAVAASMALPLLFRPVDIGYGTYYDGGFVSNLPAWSFDPHRTVDPDLHTISVSIRNKESKKSKKSRWQAFKNISDVLETAIGGARILETRMTRQADVPMEPSVDLLDFDMSKETLNKEILDGEYFFRIAMTERALKRQVMAKICYKVCEVTEKYIMEPSKDHQDIIRISLVHKTNSADLGAKTVWQFCSDGSFEKHTDDRLFFPLETSIIADAIKTGSAQLVICKDGEQGIRPTCITDTPEGLASSRERYRHAGLMNNLMWTIAIPTGTSGKWIVKIDSNISIKKFTFQRGKGTEQYENFLQDVKDESSILDRIEIKSKMLSEEIVRNMVKISQEA